MKQEPKIFCVGMHKTGTTSFSQFMTALGYKSFHNTRRSVTALRMGPDNTGEEGDGEPVPLASLIDMERLARLVARHDCFSDNPWPLLYELLDRTFPNSRFVLTSRESGSWLRSQLNYFGGTNARMREWIYGFGNPLRHQDRYLEIYEAHNRRVREYFSGRDTFLAIALEEGSDVIGRKLCEFLKINRSDLPFPTAKRSTTA